MSGAVLFPSWRHCSEVRKFQERLDLGAILVSCSLRLRVTWCASWAHEWVPCLVDDSVEAGLSETAVP